MRSVHDLTQNELEELRERFFYKMQDDGSMEEAMGGIIYEYAEDIPMDLVKIHYEDYFFVEEDFFCNLKGE